MRSSTDTIAAIATPSGPGGVGIVRISGSSALKILKTLSKRSEDKFPDRKLCLTSVYIQDEIIDQALAVAMRGPKSFTGEDVVELHGHGGAANLGRLLRAVLEAGARSADPGEFTRRAVENGCMDLSQAEAILNIAQATSERSLRAAQAQREGALSALVLDLKNQCANVLAQVEAAIDFPEDEVEETMRSRLGAQCKALANQAKTLADSHRLGNALCKGISVVITGPVNSGKSSLLNALVEEERALVSDEPGTTRDLVEVHVSWDGIQITLIDTAGLRDSPTLLEERGYELARKRKEVADIEVVLVPPGDSWPDTGVRQFIVRSKADLIDSMADNEFCLSSKNQIGLSEFKSEILKRLNIGQDQDESVVVASERHRDLLRSVATLSLAAEDSLLTGRPTEVVAVDLKSAQNCLGELVGMDVHEDVLDALFSKFCIGK